MSSSEGRENTKSDSVSTLDSIPAAINKLVITATIDGACHNEQSGLRIVSPFWPMDRKQGDSSFKVLISNQRKRSLLLKSIEKMYGVWQLSAKDSMEDWKR